MALKSERPMAEFLIGVAKFRARVLAGGGSFDGISGAELVNAGRATRLREYSQRGDL